MRKSIAPEIFRKRMLIEGYFMVQIDDEKIKEFFQFITENLKLKTYGDPIIHTTSSQGKEENQGYDGFVPLIDSGIYLAVWSHQQFLSLVIYTCKEFDENHAMELTRDFFSITESYHKLF